MQTSGYFDHAATTKISDAALQTYHEVAQHYWGNPSSTHLPGKEAALFLAEQRERAAALLNCSADTITFTAGATESNAIILSSLLWKLRPQEVLLSAAEHSSVLSYQTLLRHSGWKVSTIDAPSGIISLEKLKEALTKETRLLCAMHVNNTLGSIQDMPLLVDTVRSAAQALGSQPVHIHCDATQGLGKLAIDLEAFGVDSAAFSAHKLAGPRGVGILYNRSQGVQSQSRGGGQESGMRPGTENLAAIAAMVVAMEEAEEKRERTYEQVRVINRRLRARFAELSILSPEASSPFILTISIPPVPSEVAERILSDAGFYVSAGSACSHNVRQKGAGLYQSMHIASELAASSLRLSFSETTTVEAADALADAILTIYRNHR